MTKNKYSEYEAEFIKEAASFPITWESAVDCNVLDDEGNVYLDFSSGIFVTNTGHSNAKIREAILDQLDENLLFSFSFPTEIRKRFVDKLMSMVPKYFDTVALYSTGSGATDRAIQIARKYTGKKYVASVYNSFHGNTSLLQDISKSQKYKILFPIDKTELDFDEDIKHMEPENICAFILEGYQGWSAYFYPKKYVQKLAKWCKDNNIILIFDEIQSGFKRTGPMFTCEDYEVKPDMICFGKAASGCIPLSGILGTKKIMNCMNDEKFASTHSGNTLSMAVGLANLKEIDRIDSNEVRRLGEVMMNRLKEMYSKYDIIDFVTGKGLLSAIHFINDDVGIAVTKRCLKKGLMLVNTGRNTLKIGPPLIISQEDLTNGLDIIEESIKEIENGRDKN